MKTQAQIEQTNVDTYAYYYGKTDALSPQDLQFEGTLVPHYSLVVKLKNIRKRLLKGSLSRITNLNNFVQ